MNMLIDVRNVAPAVRVPTLVLHNTMDGWVAVERGRDLARADSRCDCGSPGGES